MRSTNTIMSELGRLVSPHALMSLTKVIFDLSGCALQFLWWATQPCNLCVSLKGTDLQQLSLRKVREQLEAAPIRLFKHRGLATHALGGLPDLSELCQGVTWFGKGWVAGSERGGHGRPSLRFVAGTLCAHVLTKYTCNLGTDRTLQNPYPLDIMRRSDFGVWKEDAAQIGVPYKCVYHIDCLMVWFTVSRCTWSIPRSKA